MCRGGYTCTDRRVETQVREPAPGAEPSIPPGGALRGSEGVLEASVLRVWESSLHLSELFGRGSLLGGGVLGSPPLEARAAPRRALPGGLSTPLGRGAGRWRTSTREGLSKPPCCTIPWLGFSKKYCRMEGAEAVQLFARSRYAGSIGIQYNW